MSDSAGALDALLHAGAQFAKDRAADGVAAVDGVVEEMLPRRGSRRRVEYMATARMPPERRGVGGGESVGGVGACLAVASNTRPVLHFSRANCGKVLVAMWWLPIDAT